MRTWAIETAPDGITRHGRHIELRDLHDDELEGILSRVGVESVIIKRPHGSTEYHTIEYECRDCDGYGHSEGSDKCIAQLDDGCPND